MAVWHSNGYNRMTIIQFKSKLTVVMVYLAAPANTQHTFYDWHYNWMRYNVLFAKIRSALLITHSRLYVHFMYSVPIWFAYICVCYVILAWQHFRICQKKWSQSTNFFFVLSSDFDGKTFLILFSYATNIANICSTRILADLFIFMISVWLAGLSVGHK